MMAAQICRCRACQSLRALLRVPCRHTFCNATAGAYEVEIQQCGGAGSGGAEVAVEIGAQTLMFTVQDTGHVQQMIQRTIGQVEFAAGKHTLAVKPRTKPGVARHGLAPRRAPASAVTKII